jgi:hypothetical protein
MSPQYKTQLSKGEIIHKNKSFKPTLMNQQQNTTEPSSQH